MNPRLIRPFGAAAGFFALCLVNDATKERQLGPMSLGILAVWLIACATMLVVWQHVRKKELGWVGAIVGVWGLTVLVVAVTIAVKR